VAPQSFFPIFSICLSQNKAVVSLPWSDVSRGIVALWRLLESSTWSARAKITELVEYMPNELDDLGDSDE